MGVLQNIGSLSKSDETENNGWGRETSRLCHTVNFMRKTNRFCGTIRICQLLNVGQSRLNMQKHCPIKGSGGWDRCLESPIVCFFVADSGLRIKFKKRY